MPSDHAKIPFTPGDTTRIRVSRSGILPIAPGDIATVTHVGIRNFTEPYVAVTVTLPTGTVYTSFGPEDLEHLEER
jgi:hypothetical protein